MQYARHTTNGETAPKIPSIQDLRTAQDTSPVRQLLKAAGYNPSCQDFYASLGINRIEGPIATTRHIAARGQRALQIVDFGRYSPAGSSISSEFEQLSSHFQDAISHCTLDFDAAKEAREILKGPTTKTPPWQELGYSVLVDMQDAITKEDPTAAIFLQLSNLQEIDFSHFPNLASKAEALHAYESTHGSPGAITQWLLDCQASGATVWGPRDTAQILKIATAWRNILDERTQLRTMQLVLPIMIPPGCKEAQHITDLWRHPLLKPDWQDIVSDIRLYTPQVQTITSGPHGPIHSLKHLVRITLS